MRARTLFEAQNKMKQSSARTAAAAAACEMLLARTETCANKATHSTYAHTRPHTQAPATCRLWGSSLKLTHIAYTPACTAHCNGFCCCCCFLLFYFFFSCIAFKHLNCCMTHLLQHAAASLCKCASSSAAFACTQVVDANICIAGNSTLKCTYIYAHI